MLWGSGGYVGEEHYVCDGSIGKNSHRRSIILDGLQYVGVSLSMSAAIQLLHLRLRKTKQLLDANLEIASGEMIECRAWRKVLKVFALGGYGKGGFPTCKLLVQSDLVTKIAVAGRSKERADKAALEIGEKAVAVCADGTDEQKLTSLLAGYDILVNAADNKFVLPSIRAAISNGSHYCDMAWGGVVEQALQLASEAEAAGITSVLANGIHPSISNLMGVHVARQLEEVEQLQLGDASIYNFESGGELMPRQWAEEPGQSLTALQGFKSFIAMMLQMVQKNGVRTVLDYREGRWVETDPVRNGLDVPTTQGGIITSYPYSSSDPTFGSLPLDLSKVLPVEMFFSPLPSQTHDLLRENALRVLEGDTAAEAATNAFFDAVENDPHRWLTVPDDFIPPPKLWARAVGRKEGRAVRCSCWFKAPIWNAGGYFLSSVAQAVAVLKILRGETRKRGVVTAEKAFEPLPFLDEVASLLPETPPDGKLTDESLEWLG
jgi:hypothetical protein